MIRINSWLSFVCFLILSAGSALGESRTYVLEGMIKGAESGVVYVSHEYDHVQQVDSAVLKEGRFLLRVSLPEPMMVTLKLSGSLQQTSFFVSGDTVRIRAVPSRLFDAVVTGSPEQAVWERYRLDYLSKVLPRKAVGDTAFTGALDRAAESFILDHKGSLAAAMVLYDKFIVYMNVPKATALFALLTPAVQGSCYGKRVAYMLDADNRTAVGVKAPSFELPDSNGVQHHLTELRGQYVLVDFWASWCVPCRKENPGLVKAFQQYASKGFTIVSISLDNNRAQWLWAAGKDGLSWWQLSDLRGYEGAVPQLYGVHAIPQNFLLDPGGKIVERNLRGEHLFEVLGAIFSGK